MLINPIDDAVASHPVGIAVLQLPFERFSFMGILLEAIEHIDDPLVQGNVTLRDLPQDINGLLREL